MQSGEFTALLREWSKGDKSSLDALIPVVYRELHQLASGHLSKERPNHTLRPTELINEAYLSLVDLKQKEWYSRTHFFAVASQIMRQILTAHARKRKAIKRGGDRDRITLNEALAMAAVQPNALVSLDDGLIELSRLDERKARIIELRYFGGLTNQEIADVLEVSIPTIVRDNRMAEAWLLDYMQTQ